MDLLFRHMNALKRIEGLECARHVVVPESNLAWEGTHQMLEMRRRKMDEHIVMHEDHDRAGIRTDHNLKKAMALCLADKLLNDAIYFHRQLACVGESHTRGSVSERLCEQLCAYKRETFPAKHVADAPRERYHGKIGGMVDDLCIAIQLNPICKNRFFGKPAVYGTYFERLERGGEDAPDIV